MLTRTKDNAEKEGQTEWIGMKKTSTKVKIRRVRVKEGEHIIDNLSEQAGLFLLKQLFVSVVLSPMDDHIHICLCSISHSHCPYLP
jgi:hypothetical protein